MMATTTIETPEQRLDRIEQLCDENSHAMGLAEKTASEPSARDLPNWLSFAVIAAVAGTAGIIAGIALF